MDAIGDAQSLLVAHARDDARQGGGHPFERVVVVVEDDHLPWGAESAVRAAGRALDRLCHCVRLSHSRSSVWCSRCVPFSSSERSSPTVPKRSASTSWSWIVSRLTWRENRKSASPRST